MFYIACLSYNHSVDPFLAEDGTSADLDGNDLLRTSLHQAKKALEIEWWVDICQWEISRILKFLNGGTLVPYKAIFWYILGVYTQFRFLKWPLNMV